MDPAERDLLERTLKLTEDTNRMVHKMHRGVIWGRLMTLVFWAVMIFGPVVAYYYYYQSYVEPYMLKAQQLYGQLQAGNEQAQQYQSQLSNLINNLVPPSVSTGTSAKPK